jgi:hypothetical protein
MTVRLQEGRSGFGLVLRWTRLAQLTCANALCRQPLPILPIPPLRAECLTGDRCRGYRRGTGGTAPASSAGSGPTRSSHVNARRSPAGRGSPGRSGCRSTGPTVFTTRRAAPVTARYGHRGFKDEARATGTRAGGRLPWTSTTSRTIPRTCRRPRSSRKRTTHPSTKTCGGAARALRFTSPPGERARSSTATRGHVTSSRQTRLRRQWHAVIPQTVGDPLGPSGGRA